MKVGGLLLLKTFAQAKSSVITDSYAADTTKVDETKESLEYVANTNFNVCSCDLTTDSCDAFCCCDSSCPEEITSEWTRNNRCANIDYAKNFSGGVFTPCMSREEKFNFNKQNGLNNYNDPLASLLCVQIDTSPDMGTYYKTSDKDNLNELKLNATSQRHRQGFTATAFVQNVATPGDKHYKIGDKLKSLVT